jgi:nucleoside-diphosphate-sugar epimerase
VSINANTAEAARQNKVKRVFYSSSACIYPGYKQENADVVALKESDAYPAEPDSEYGWEKLFSERLYKSYGAFYEARIARFHNIFGPEGTWQGERTKAPADLSRKVAMAQNGDSIEVWGDGQQTRSFCYIDDCLEGIFTLMHSDVKEPLNIGSDRLVTINDMIDMIANLAGKNIQKNYLLDKPQGVRGRNSDNTLCKSLIGFEPKVSLEEGLEKTYAWIDAQIHKK